MDVAGREFTMLVFEFRKESRYGKDRLRIRNTQMFVDERAPG